MDKRNRLENERKRKSERSVKENVYFDYEEIGSTFN